MCRCTWRSRVSTYYAPSSSCPTIHIRTNAVCMMLSVSQSPSSAQLNSRLYIHPVAFIPQIWSRNRAQVPPPTFKLKFPPLLGSSPPFELYVNGVECSVKIGVSFVKGVDSLLSKNRGKVSVYTFNKTLPIFHWEQAALTRYGDRSHCIHRVPNNKTVPFFIVRIFARC